MFWKQILKNLSLLMLKPAHPYSSYDFRRWGLWGTLPNSRGTISKLDIFYKKFKFMFIHRTYEFALGTWEESFLSFTVWVLGIELRLSGLAASALTH